jgi:DNA-binding GntR family transcriptional regulator
LTQATRRVFDFLTEKSGRKGEVWWGQQRIAAELGLSRRTVIRAIAALVLLEKIESARRGPTSNLYRMMCQNVTEEVTKCHNTTLEVNFKREHRRVERKPPQHEDIFDRAYALLVAQGYK